MASETTETHAIPDGGTETTKTSQSESVDETTETNVTVEKKTATAEANEI